MAQATARPAAASSSASRGSRSLAVVQPAAAPAAASSSSPGSRATAPADAANSEAKKKNKRLLGGALKRPRFGKRLGAAANLVPELQTRLLFAVLSVGSCKRWET